MKSLKSFLNNLGSKQIAIYVAIAVICVIIIGFAVYFQFFYSNGRPR